MSDFFFNPIINIIEETIKKQQQANVSQEKEKQAVINAEKSEINEVGFDIETQNTQFRQGFIDNFENNSCIAESLPYYGLALPVVTFLDQDKLKENLIPGSCLDNRIKKAEELSAKVFPSQEERADAISKNVNSNPPDLLLTQETFNDTIENVIENVKDVLPYSHRETDSNIFPDFDLTGSGLTALSKHEIIKTDFRQFPDLDGSDNLSNKGISFTRVNVEGVGPVDIYNTHYQAGDVVTNRIDETLLNNLPEPLKNAYNNIIEKTLTAKQKIRLDSNKLMENFINENDKGYPTFITGDFNMPENSQEYYDLVKRLGVKDSFRVPNGKDVPGYTNDPNTDHYVDKNETPFRLDYIFYKDGENVKVEVENSKVVNDKPVDGVLPSDHFGVRTNFKLKKTN